MTNEDPEILSIRKKIIHQCKIGEYTLDSFKIDSGYGFDLYKEDEKDHREIISAEKLLELLIFKCSTFCKFITERDYHVIFNTRLESSILFIYNDMNQNIFFHVKDKSREDYLCLTEIYFKNPKYDPNVNPPFIRFCNCSDEKKKKTCKIL